MILMRLSGTYPMKLCWAQAQHLRASRLWADLEELFLMKVQWPLQSHLAAGGFTDKIEFAVWSWPTLNFLIYGSDGLAGCLPLLSAKI